MEGLTIYIRNIKLKMVKDMNNDAEEKNISSVNSSLPPVIFSGMLLLNGVFSAYVGNYKPKIGFHHIWICSALGVLLTVFSVWGVVQCVTLLKKSTDNKKLTAIVLVVVVLVFALWIGTAFPYCKDLIGGSKTVTTDSYLVVLDNLYFLNDDGDEIKLTIPTDTASEFRAKDNYEYDFENNLLKYYDKITVTYFPNSKVIISALSEG